MCRSSEGLRPFRVYGLGLHPERERLSLNPKGLEFRPKS